MACLKAKGLKAKINNPVSKYADLLPYLESVTMEELVMAVRRQSQGFARGSSAYRGVTHHPNGRWEARLGVPGSRHIYLGAIAPLPPRPSSCAARFATARASGDCGR